MSDIDKKIEAQVEALVANALKTIREEKAQPAPKTKAELIAERLAAAPSIPFAKYYWPGQPSARIPV